jgi:ribosomal protein L40E
MKNNVKNKKYKIIALVSLVLVALLCLASCTGAKKADDASGECEGGVKWKYTASDKTLEFKGNGAIPSYKSSSEVPWAAAFESIEKIEINDGVTAIGSYAFYGCSKLEKTDIAESVTSVGKYAFDKCNPSKLNFHCVPDSCAEIYAKTHRFHKIVPLQAEIEICPSCSAKLAHNAVFCHICGTKIK